MNGRFVHDQYRWLLKIGKRETWALSGLPTKSSPAVWRSDPEGEKRRQSFAFLRLNVCDLAQARDRSSWPHHNQDYKSPPDSNQLLESLIKCSGKLWISAGFWCALTWCILKSFPAIEEQFDVCSRVFPRLTLKVQVKGKIKSHRAISALLKCTIFSLQLSCHSPHSLNNVTWCLFHKKSVFGILTFDSHFPPLQV